MFQNKLLLLLVHLIKLSHDDVRLTLDVSLLKFGMDKDVRQNLYGMSNILLKNLAK